MAIRQPKDFAQIQKFLLDGIFVKSKILRRIIDKDKSIVQITKLNKEYAKEFNSFKKQIEKAVKEEGADSQKRIQVGEGTFQIRTAKRMVDTMEAGRKGEQSSGVDRGFANFRQQNQFFKKAFPDMVEGAQLGHQNISILRGSIAAALDIFPGDHPNRKRLLALFAVVKEIDAVNKKGVDLVDLVNKVRKTAARGRNFKTDWKKDVSTLKGLEERITLEYEEADLNQEKGLMSSIIGGYFKDIVIGETKKVDEFLANIEYENLKGSPTLIDDLLDLAADTIDPKKKFKTRKTKGTRRDKGKSSSYIKE